MVVDGPAVDVRAEAVVVGPAVPDAQAVEAQGTPTRLRLTLSRWMSKTRMLLLPSMTVSSGPAPVISTLVEMSRSPTAALGALLPVRRTSAPPGMVSR